MIDTLGIVAVLALVTTILVVTLVLRLIPSLGSAVLEGEANRIHTMDGVRGVLALSVLVHHGILTQVQAQHRDWEHVASNLSNQLGSGAVALFFMISAYLFAGGLIRNKGALRTTRMLEGRVMRITPLYVLCLVTMMLFVAIQTSFILRVPPIELAKQVARWIPFGFVRHDPVNDLQDSANLLGQVWTLKYEWMLYLLLPILAFAHRLVKSPIPVYLGLAICAFQWSFFALFVAGTAASQLVRFDTPAQRLVWQIAGALGFLTVMLELHESTDWRSAILLTPFFVALLQGHRLYALIGIRPLRFLGEISYSVYLIHGFFIWAVSRWVIGMGTYAILSPLQLYGAIVLAAVLAVAGSVLTFKFVEKPLMRLKPVTGRSPRLDAPSPADVFRKEHP